MMSIEEQAALAAKAVNPASSTAPDRAERRRIPMSVPRQRFAVPAIPGYFLYWFRGDPMRLQQALDAGYEFVERDEVEINNFSLGGDAAKDGNSDLGSRVSVLAGGGMATPDGQPQRMYLMKQKLEWYNEDNALREQESHKLVEALSAHLRNGSVGGKAAGETDVDLAKRYTRPDRQNLPDFFKQKRRTVVR